MHAMLFERYGARLSAEKLNEALGITKAALLPDQRKDSPGEDVPGLGKRLADYRDVSELSTTAAAPGRRDAQMLGHDPV